MIIQQINEENLKEAYGVLCQFLLDNNKRKGLYSTFVRIEPQGKTISHAHFEEEVFYIITGAGQLIVDQVVYSVKAGDLVKLPSFSKHELTNTGSQNLDFLSVYSEDYTVPSLPAKAIITVAPPTPNGPLHLGHISGPYLAADVLRRYLLLQNSSVKTLSATDDFQNYVFEKANALGQEVNSFRSEMRNRIQQGFKALQIEFNEFSSPATEEGYSEKVLHFFTRAKSLGVIEKTFLPYPYCENCQEFLTDALADGICPHCLSSSHGACENCGMVTMPTDLRSVKCDHGHLQITNKPVEVYTFNLTKYFSLIEEEVKKLALSTSQKNIQSHIKAQKELKVLVTHPTNKNFGVQVPGTNQVLHVWFEMAANYESFSLQDSYWISCFGFDNSFYYLFFIPALLKAMNPHSRLMNAIVKNEFLLLEGLKFSTSRQHAIWADETKLDSDFLRMYLSFIRPTNQQTDFSEADFKSFSQDLEKKFLQLEGLIKTITQQQSTDLYFKEIQNSLVETNRFTRDFEKAMSVEQFNPRQATRKLLDFLDQILFFEDSVRGQKIMLKAFLTALQIFMPQTADKYFNLLGCKIRIWKNDWSLDYDEHI